MNLHHNFIKNLNYEKTRNLIFFNYLFNYQPQKLPQREASLQY
jgi:hypothetical protein